MTTPDSKLGNLLWYAMPNLVCLPHCISNEKLAHVKLTLKAPICSSYGGDIVLGETMVLQIQTVGCVTPLVEALTRVGALAMANVKAMTSKVINDQNHALASIGGFMSSRITIGSAITHTCCSTREMFDRVEKRSI